MESVKHSLWVEKYRPNTLQTYIGNDHLKSKVSVYLENGDVPHLLLFGRAGTGKTTLAKLIVSNIDCDYLYINASDENSVDVVLTCNYVERIIDPIQSRCQSFQIIPPDRKEVAQHLANILDNESVSYDIKNIATIVNGGYPDIRRVINGAQRQVVNNELVIDENTITQNDYKLQVLDILKTQDKKNSFQNIRQLLADSKVSDFSDLFRLLFDTIDDWGTGHIAECILILSKYQQSDAVVVDKEINIMSMFVEIIGTIK